MSQGARVDLLLPSSVQTTIAHAFYQEGTRPRSAWTEKECLERGEAAAEAHFAEVASRFAAEDQETQDYYMAVAGGIITAIMSAVVAAPPMPSGGAVG